MSKDLQNIADKLEKEGHKTLDFFAGIEEAQWPAVVYSDDQDWTVHHLLAHFVEVEESIPRLIRSILDGGSGVSEDFDIDRHNQKHTPQMAENSRQFLLEEFKRLRRETVELVNGMQESDLELEGRHPFLEVTAIKEMLKLMYIHLNMHMRDIKRVLRGS
ncbi:MAG: DinB family protein [Chloroflexi bacterium]|nr:MAG: DinB family protein [Chloroflexota bacterium]MBL1194194.1 DinB family protein [Chloroflexota bacterium]NOH11487.1 DinB family protein [Chloroflexota bacterium]